MKKYKIILCAISLLLVLTLVSCQNINFSELLKDSEELQNSYDDGLKEEFISLARGKWVAEVEDSYLIIEFKGEKVIDPRESVSNNDREGEIVKVTQSNGTIYEATIYFPELELLDGETVLAEKQKTIYVSSADRYARSIFVTDGDFSCTYVRAETAQAEKPVINKEKATQPEKEEVEIPDAVENGNLAAVCLFPSDTQYITEADLIGKTKDEVAMIRNEIYARHGYIFKQEKFRNYFTAQAWYVPNESFSENMFNGIERANIDFIVNYEKAKGWRK